MNTSYLSLTVSMSQTTTPMSSFYSIQDGNYEIIDAFASNTAGSIASNLSAIGTLSSNITTLESTLSSVTTQLSGVYALTGSVTLYSASWNASVYTLAMPVLKLNDSVFFKPLTASDQTLLESAHCFTSASVSQVTFTADTQPTSDINLKYTITKGEPWVSLSVTETNCTHIGDNIVSTDEVTRLLFSADSGYGLTSSVTVTGASYTWDKDSGVLLLSNPTGPVSVTVTAQLVVAIYGVSGLYQSSPALTRTDDAVNMSAVVNSSTGLVSSDFDNAFPWNEATVETINGNKFLHMPEMWFRVGKDSSDRITDIAVSKEQGSTGDWYKVDSFYYGCYGGSLDANNKLCSVTGVARKHSATRSNFRTYASANGSGYQQLDLYHHTVMMFLWWIEWANKNSQSIMRGRDGSIGGSSVVNTGGTNSLTTSSGYDTYTGQMRWHYIEDYIGNLEEFVDGADGIGSSYRVTADPSKFNDTNSMNTLGYGYPSNASSSNQCISAYGWDSNNPFLVQPKEQTGRDFTVQFCDTNGTENGFVLFCGTRYDGRDTPYGISRCTRYYGSYAGDAVGARLLYKPAS